jgi:hypothetical protein
MTHDTYTYTQAERQVHAPEPAAAAGIILIGVVSVVSQYNCVCYCDTCYMQSKQLLQVIGIHAYKIGT